MTTTATTNNASRVETCHFCSQPCYPSKGITFVRNDAKLFRFCRSKCHKNFKMKRNPRKLGWTKAFRRAHGKEMTVDSTLQFQQRRNIPVRYNRDLVARTLEAMSRVGEIRAKRERQFYKNRMAGNKAIQLEADKKLVAENQHLLPPQNRDKVQETLDDELDQTMEIEGDEITVEDLQKSAINQEVDGNKTKAKGPKKQKKLVRGKGAEEMDVDE